MMVNKKIEIKTWHVIGAVVITIFFMFNMGSTVLGSRQSFITDFLIEATGFDKVIRIGILFVAAMFALPMLMMMMQMMMSMARPRQRY